MTKRNDIHRPGAIIPADYEYVLSYNGATTDGGWPVPSFRINCQLDRRLVDPKSFATIKEGEHDADGMCCIVGMRNIAQVRFVATGGTNQCSVCSTFFVYGDVWRHVPTGEYIHIGHNCADKYELLVDRSAYELAEGRHRAASARQIVAERNGQERREFLDANPGLEDALKTEHSIVQDIAYRFQERRELSPKQVALVMKLAHEAKNPKAAEKHVKAPEGKQTFRGRIVSVKTQEGFRGGVDFKMLVKVTTPEGVWLAWGTAPRALLDETVNHKGALRGAEALGTEVEITATLKPGREPHFAIMQRPRGKVVALACGGVGTPETGEGCQWCQELVGKAIVEAFSPFAGDPFAGLCPAVSVPA